MKLIDGIVPEPPEGAQMDADAAAQFLRQTLKQALDELSRLPSQQIIEERYDKFRQMGGFFNEVPA
jgi:acetyl-CoA carboxylase alpha subunit